MKEDLVVFDNKTGIAQIKEGVEVIPKITILGNQKVKTIIIPEGVKKIESNAFANLRNLKKVILPSTLTQIEPMGFCVCGAAEVELPDGIVNLGTLALDFDNGIIKVNASNFELIEMVDESLLYQRYTAQIVDNDATFSKLKCVFDDKDMTLKKAREIIGRQKRYDLARKKQEERARKPEEND